MRFPLLLLDLLERGEELPPQLGQLLLEVPGILRLTGGLRALPLRFALGGLALGGLTRRVLLPALRLSGPVVAGRGLGRGRRLGKGDGTDRFRSAGLGPRRLGRGGLRGIDPRGGDRSSGRLGFRRGQGGLDRLGRLLLRPLLLRM